MALTVRRCSHLSIVRCSLAVSSMSNTCVSVWCRVDAAADLNPMWLGSVTWTHVSSVLEQPNPKVNDRMWKKKKLFFLFPEMKEQKQQKDSDSWCKSRIIHEVKCVRSFCNAFVGANAAQWLAAQTVFCLFCVASHAIYCDIVVRTIWVRCARARVHANNTIHALRMSHTCGKVRIEYDGTCAAKQSKQSKQQQPTMHKSAIKGDPRNTCWPPLGGWMMR